MPCLPQNIGTLATFSKDLGEISDAAVYVTNNEFKWVGKTSELPKEYQQADTVLSLPSHVLIPGLVNTHHHMFQCLTRCVAQVWPQAQVLECVHPYACLTSGLFSL